MVSQQGVHQQQNLHKLQGWKFETAEQYFSQKYFPKCKRAPHVIKENGHFLFQELYLRIWRGHLILKVRSVWEVGYDQWT